MARNSEMTRQWQVLRDIDAARTGITIPKLAAAREVHQRTIRRDLDVAPERLATMICAELDGARASYDRRHAFPMLRMALPAEQVSVSA